MAKANPFIRSFKYFSAWFGAKVDERADPKIQIQQAIEEAQHQHEELTRQAASVIGNQRQLEMKLERQLSQIETLQTQARQALVLSDNARAAGDEQKAGEFEQTAQALANQLVGAEQSVQDLKALHDQSLGAAQQAREAVQNNAMLLREKLTERTKLLSQLEQAKMQETVSSSLQQMNELSAPKNTPSLEEIRDKIEHRYATALGQADLAQNDVGGRMLEVKRATLNLQGSARLEEIRASLAGGGAPAVGAGSPRAVEQGSTDAEAVEEPIHREIAPDQ
ncbi:MAG TPA: PspA/IM30 family protein [Jatrophihabitantaceae bacterium]|jgi:phage shock protein A|nr:PspA/IM30 family protein [Jatrophihabitantaceae bacterium]